MLTRRPDLAVQYRLFALGARERSQGSLLPRVQETHARAAARWDALADIEDLIVSPTTTRRDLAIGITEPRGGADTAVETKMPPQP